LSKFEHLKRFDVSRDAVRYDLDQLTGDMYLMVRPATDANKPLLNDALRRVNARPRRARAKMDAERLDKTRDEDRQLYSQHVVVGWSVKDGEGKAVPFSKEECLDFLTQLPNWVFDDLRAFCGDPNNFLNLPEDDEEPEAGDTTLGNSSQSG
jgi:hypothetical protein